MPAPALVENGRGATVLRPGGLGRTGGDRALLAVGDHLDAGLIDALRQQEVTGGRSPALAKSEVVFAGATLVTMTFDGDGDGRVGVQETGLTKQRTLGVAAESRAVIVEIHRVTDGSQSIFGAGAGRRCSTRGR